MIKNKILFLLIFVLFITSCEKKYVEVVPVIEILQDISIPNANSIKYFTFINDQVGYASDTSNIYKTVNGGSTWTKLSLPIIGAVCSGVEFFDPLNGLAIINNGLYSTVDGGTTWNPKGNAANFIGITESGLGIYVRDNGINCSVYKSMNKGSTFSLIGTLDLDGTFTDAVLTDSRIIALSDEVNYYHRAYGMDVNSNTNFTIGFGGLIFNDHINDVYLNNTIGAAAGIKGNIMEISGTVAYSRDSYNHTYPYYSIDGYGDFIVAVGYHTITSNMQLTEDQETVWNEVLDTNGNGFEQTFYKIKFINSSSFYLSGSKGLLWKVKI